VWRAPARHFPIVVRSSWTSLAFLTDGALNSNRVRSGKICSSGQASRPSACDTPIMPSEILSLPVDPERPQAPIPWGHGDEDTRGQNGLGVGAAFFNKASQWAGKRVSAYVDGEKNRRRMSLPRHWNGTAFFLGKAASPGATCAIVEVWASLSRGQSARSMAIRLFASERPAATGRKDETPRSVEYECSSDRMGLADSHECRGWP
jgi:hypothetical protein